MNVYVIEGGIPISPLCWKPATASCLDLHYSDIKENELLKLGRIVVESTEKKVKFFKVIDGKIKSFLIEKVFFSAESCIECYISKALENYGKIDCVTVPVRIPEQAAAMS
ncbi:TPA: hypothetical protein DIC40_02040 [Patescibacteria group bacterium]|nr:hypothetical protein P148_SR1C00001G0270 [candidate division SR1 bacterium RAAC1_SR1_1]HCY20635.1 hypothetical protein [Candidatus Gracilibacteria bacterium]